MAKNRKAQPFTERFGAAIKAFVLCLLIGGAGVGYVWQKNQVHKLGVEIKQREDQLAVLQRQNKMRADHLATLMSPLRLEERIKKLNLGLVEPKLSQIVRLVETPIPSSTPVPLADREQLLTQASR